MTGEYSVLRGAVALSLPTTFGQHLTVNQSRNNTLNWISLDQAGEIWFSAELASEHVIKSSDTDKAETLLNILAQAKKLNPDFNFVGHSAQTTLEFNRQWGLGSSSTLIALVAEWAKVDAMKLFFNSLSGSGYDVATAFTGLPILYQRVDGDAFMKSVTFSPPFKHDLFFVYLGEKQNSAAEVAKFSATSSISTEQLDAISNISKTILETDTLEAFEDLMLEHEALTSIILKRPTIFETRFADYPHLVKSLGAWGGDFILATGSPNQHKYFIEQGYHTILSWDEMIGT